MAYCVIIAKMDSQHFVPSQGQEFNNICLKILKSGESGVILFPPNTGKSNKIINNFIDNTKTEAKLFKFDLTFYEFEDVYDFEEELHTPLNLAKKSKVCILISNGHTLIRDKNYPFLNAIIDLQAEIPNLSFIFLFNIDITHPEIAKNIKTSIFGNIAYYPLYEGKDIKGFVEHLAKKWSMKLTGSQINQIVHQCGGYFWLVKQSVRGLRDNPDLKVENLIKLEGIKVALEQFYTSLLDSERNVLQSLILSRKFEGDLEKHSFEYLKRIGLIRSGEVTIPLLVSYVSQYIPKTNIEIKDNLIYFNFVNVDSHFSKKEKRIFKAFINNKGQSVTRDKIAKAIWPINTEDFYSDWAVDRLVARLRAKIKKLGIPKEIIKTIRNQGYVLED